MLSPKLFTENQAQRAGLYLAIALRACGYPVTLSGSAYAGRGRGSMTAVVTGFGHVVQRGARQVCCPTKPLIVEPLSKTKQKQKEIQLLAVDHSARASMKNAASCEN